MTKDVLERDKERVTALQNELKLTNDEAEEIFDEGDNLFSYNDMFYKVFTKSEADEEVKHIILKRCPFFPPIKLEFLTKIDEIVFEILQQEGDFRALSHAIHDLIEKTCGIDKLVEYVLKTEEGRANTEYANVLEADFESNVIVNGVTYYIYHLNPFFIQNH